MILCLSLIEMLIRITPIHMLFTHLDNVVKEDALIDISCMVDDIDSIIVSFNPKALKSIFSKKPYSSYYIDRF